MFKVVFITFIVLTSLYSKKCSFCHEKEAKSCKNSIHYTLKKAINITRKAWGIKDSNVTLQSLPLPKKDINSPKDLVDDFLRRKCLKCHIDTRKSEGCLYCHNRHDKKGNYYKAKTSMKKCLKCHNKEYIGTDYKGWFPKDFEQSYRAPLSKKGYFPPTKYGIDYHHLSEDIHYKAGLKCVDCHKDLHSNSKISCKDCHKNPSSKNHPSYHKKIECIACHASWQINSYELSVFRDDTTSYDKYKRVIMQEDTYLQNFLQKALKQKKKPLPMMPDWVSRKLKRGIWYSGYRYRRWEDFYLANDKSDGKIKLFRPLYQYRISYKNKDGKMLLDDVRKIDNKDIEVWLPYYPHTIGKYAKSCEMCHNNPLLLNQKRYGNDIASDLKLPKYLYNAIPLTKEQIKKMISKRYKTIRAKLLLQNFGLK